MQFNSYLRTEGRTLLKRITDRSDGEESIELKVVGVHLKQRSKKLWNYTSQCISCLISH